MYRKVFGTNIIKRLKDNAFIPIDPENKDYKEYLLFIKNGGVTLEAEIPVKNSELDLLFSNAIFSSIIEALAQESNIDLEKVKDAAKQRLDKKRGKNE